MEEEFVSAPPRAGGDTTFDDRTASAFENPAPNLSDPDMEAHFVGDVAFEATFVSAPAQINAGLGPVFNNNACGKCHVRNGRGLPVTGHESLGSPLLVRVSQTTGQPGNPGEPIPVLGLGTQIQDHAIYGYQPEARVFIDWTEESGSYGDGEPYSLRRPMITIELADGTPLPTDVMTSARIPSPVFGLGLLEAVPEGQILAFADETDADGDGISGRVNRVWSVAQGQTVLGRFGWKANNPDLTQQAAGAYANDMGVSSPMFPEPDGATDITEETMRAAAFYTQTLAVPRRARWDDPDILAGARLFRDMDCEHCHVAQLTTGDHQISALRDQVIYPYTDLLLHDMGQDLADGRPDFLADGREWRTPPLWGIGLTERVLTGAGYLHDGRARSLAEAILWHGGEATAARDAFRALPAIERNVLLEFLHSL
jgi:CxxC motif-containing protein (DUF1111 family)